MIVFSGILWFGWLISIIHSYSSCGGNQAWSHQVRKMGPLQPVVSTTRSVLGERASPPVRNWTSPLGSRETAGAVVPATGESLYWAAALLGRSEQAAEASWQRNPMSQCCFRIRALHYWYDLPKAAPGELQWTKITTLHRLHRPNEGRQSGESRWPIQDLSKDQSDVRSINPVIPRW